MFHTVVEQCAPLIWYTGILICQCIFLTQCALPKITCLHPQLFCPRDFYSEVSDTMTLLLSSHGLTRSSCYCVDTHMSGWTCSCFSNSSENLFLIIQNQFRGIVVFLKLSTMVVKKKNRRYSVCTTIVGHEQVVKSLTNNYDKFVRPIHYFNFHLLSFWYAKSIIWGNWHIISFSHNNFVMGILFFPFDIQGQWGIEKLNKFLLFLVSIQWLHIDSNLYFTKSTPCN